ncbi:MAG TPA: hypothetical protein ENK18_04015 [Deltaproteobacteria bacterium]|nr:hypothetical protein [Deltaproteobacteria bacterium]
MIFIASQLFACVTETGNPEYDFQGSLVALARTSSPADVGAGAGRRAEPRVVVDQAAITLREIRFEEAGSCGGGGRSEADIEGPWTVELIQAGALPLELAVRSFCRLRLRLDRAEGGVHDDRSVSIEGTRRDGTPFVIESRATPELELRAEGGEPFQIDDEALDLLLAFDLAGWLAFDLDVLSPGGDGTIRIDDDTNDGALDQFEDALEDSLQLFEDTQGDRDVADGDTPLAAAP